MSGDINGNGTTDVPSLATRLATNGITGIRYGLIGFGEETPSGTIRFAHSQLFEPDNPNSLFGDPSQMTTGELNAVFNGLAQLGGDEDGWDALEHAIAEYDIGDEAVPIFVLVQNDEGRIDLNQTLTREGVLASLESKNAILNVLVPGEATAHDENGFALGHSELFLIDGAAANERVLGVEADVADDVDVTDMIHSYHGIDTVTHAPTNGQFDDTPGSLDDIDGETTNGETEDAYVRLAWDTGGAAWDVGIVETFFENGGITSPEANQLRDDFIESLSNQIMRADEHGQVFHEDEVVLAINYGGNGLAGEGFDEDTGDTADTRLTTTETIDTTSNSIPLEAHEVFQSARTGDTTNHQGDDINLSFSTVENGTYVVELFFAELTDLMAPTDREFDVVVEGNTLLNDYAVYADHAKINTSESSIENFSDPAGQYTGIVKRFLVQVSDADGAAGLQIDLLSVRGDPILNGLRILRPKLPGDYNRDGVVGAADYTIWRDTLGSTTDLRADGDGSGAVDMNDYIYWKDRFGNTTGHVMADASGNGATDIADYNIWASTYGSTTDLRADCNEDGIVDDADFDIWFDTFGSTMEIDAFGLLSSLFAPDAPPAVVGFALSLPGDATIDFADRVGSGEQMRSLPLTAANTLSITFSQDVTVTQGALQVTNLDGTSPNVSDFTYDAASQTATWTFDAALANGRYLALLSDTVLNSEGELLDGEFFNPTSLTDTGSTLFPSGDGREGGDFRFHFTVLFGDSDHDNISGTTNYEHWQSTEPGAIYVSTTSDEADADLSFGDVSLREAVIYANAASSPTTIFVPAGEYEMTLEGSESGGNDGNVNDLDVTGNVTIVGAGPGLTIINGHPSTYTGNMMDQHIFEVQSSGQLNLSRVTLANNHGTFLGTCLNVKSGGVLCLDEAAVVNNQAYGLKAGVVSTGGDVTITRSVFTGNSAFNSAGVVTYDGSLTIGESLFALNVGFTPRNVRVYGTATLVNLGNNLYDDATGGFFDTTPGSGDHLGSPNYVVTTVADTFDHTDDSTALSIREAVDLANQATGQQEIWVPAWAFVLTRDRGSHTSDTDVSYGDLDVSDSLIVRGIAGQTSIAWKPGVVDAVFDLLGDYNHDGQADYGSVSAADYTLWQDQNGSSGGFEQFSADGDDDGDVDADDYDIWTANFGHTLDLFALSV